MVTRKYPRKRRRVLFVEGAGRADLNTACKAGFKMLLEKAGIRGVLPRVVPCGSRQEAFSRFCGELALAGPDDILWLLVDGEAPVTSQDPWEHVKQREGDGWIMPEQATAGHLHFMVEVMESWFLADPDALKRYFGKGFRSEALPTRTDIEAVAKLEVYRVLETATKDTPSGPFRKGEHGRAEQSFELLAEIDPKKLEEASPWAKRLFKELRPT